MGPLASRLMGGEFLTKRAIQLCESPGALRLLMVSLKYTDIVPEVNLDGLDYNKLYDELKFSVISRK